MTGPTTLLTPDNTVALLVDLQPQFAFGVNSIDGQTLLNNVTGLGKTLALYGVPTVLATISAKQFGGPTFTQLASLFPDTEVYDRTVINAWADERVVSSIESTGRRKLVLAGLWTEVCVAHPALSAIAAGYDVYVVADACGDTSVESHNLAMHRMMQAGAVPITWVTLLQELQADWGIAATADGASEIAQEHGGTWGIGIRYAAAMGVGQ
ncbi:hydrolase [Kribbella sp. NPDC026611]|uniref:hydrolase n=1 Tax=Kribbella sp. NPDC026611 TaxID=3154911 RepID=UPI0033D1AA0C